MRMGIDNNGMYYEGTPKEMVEFNKEMTKQNNQTNQVNSDQVKDLLNQAGKAIAKKMFNDGKSND